MYVKKTPAQITLYTDAFIIPILQIRFSVH